MYCDYCGKKIDNDSRFCSYCGANLAQYLPESEYRRRNSERYSSGISTPTYVSKDEILEQIKAY